MLWVGICQYRLPLFIFKAVKSPILLIKNTSSPLITNESFFLDLINGFSVLKFQSSEPSFVEKHLIVLSKSIIKNLFFKTFIFELKPVLFSIDFINLPSFKLIKLILDRLSAAIIFLSACAKYIIGFNFFSFFV